MKSDRIDSSILFQDEWGPYSLADIVNASHVSFQENTSPYDLLNWRRMHRHLARYAYEDAPSVVDRVNAPAHPYQDEDGAYNVGDLINALGPFASRSPRVFMRLTRTTIHAHQINIQRGRC